MQASLHFKAVTSEKTLALTTTGGVMTVIGSSVPSGISQVTLDVRTVYLYPEEGKSGMVAVATWQTKDKHGGNWIPFVFPIIWKEKKPLIELDQVWIPPADRYGLVHGLWVDLTIGPDVYSTSQACESEGKRYLPDTNLACRYLAGEATAEEVQTAAKQLAEEKSLKEQLERERVERATLEQNFFRIQEENAALRCKVIELRSTRSQQN